MADFGRSASKLSGIADALRSDFGRMTGAFAAAQVGVSAVLGAFNSLAAAVHTANKEVLDAERLNIKLTAVFDGAAGSLGRLTDQANDLAKVSSFFDPDDIREGQAALRLYDLTEQEISKLIPVAANLAAMFGTTVEASAQKLALGLTGMTRGLKEFGIVVPEGSKKADIFAAILAKGEKAAIGAETANQGLTGAMGRLDKAQRDFNGAIGDLLSGPQSAFLDFLTKATQGAANMAKEMNGAAIEAGRVAKEIVVATGEVRDVQGTGGVDIFGPGSLTARYAAKTAPPAAAGPVKQAEAAARVTKKAADDTARIQAEAIRREDERIAFERRLLEDRIAANEAQIIKDNKAAQEIIDNFDAANRKRNEETVRAFEQAQALIEQANRDFASGITAAGRLLIDIVRGDASLGGIIRAFGGLATGAGAAFGGPIGAALAGVGVEVAAAIADGFGKQESAADELRKAGQKLTEAGETITEAERERRIDQAKNLARAAGLTEGDIARAVAAARGDEAGVPGRRTQGLPGVGETVSFVGGVPTVGPNGQQFGAAGAELEQGMLTVGGFRPEPLPGFVTGAPGQGILSPGTAPSGQIGADTSGAFADLVRILRELFAVQLDEAGAGMTERQPLYVFDVAAGRDEFTRAPRGLFFRPVGSGRGVDGGQAVSGVSSNTTNRATSRRTG